MKKLIFLVFVSFPIVLLDYLTKNLVLAHVKHYEVIPVLPFLRIVNVQNTGGAFGLFSSLGNNIFIFISLVAIIFIILYLLKVTKRLELLSLSLILGGAIGNFIDRLRIGKVIDFIDFFIGKWHWPAFNVADSALSVGIIIFLVSNLMYRKKG